MPGTKSFTSFAAALAVFFGFLAFANPCAAQRGQVLYSFCSQQNCPDGYQPVGGVVFDAKGNLYGTTQWGGTHGGGTAFELAPATGGNWTEKTLYDFCSQTNCSDGYEPEASLILDSAGNLYGTTFEEGGGTVFELVPGAGGTWTEDVLASVDAGTYAGVIMDSAGNLYGSTVTGGIHNGGSVFEVSPGANGTWTEKVIHSFAPYRGGYESGAFGDVVFDEAGNLYGTVYGGGRDSNNCDYSGCGKVFELLPNADGTWSEKTLHWFRGLPDGANPWAGVVLDSVGNVYGTTYSGGTGQCENGDGNVVGCGVVFMLSPSENGQWSEKVLHSFDDNGFDGYNSFAGLTLDASGNLYGTTSAGGTRDSGTIFRMTKHGDGKWSEKVIYNFGRYGDGAVPLAGVTFGADGKLYGTTFYGGAYENGAVFEIAP